MFSNFTMREKKSNFVELFYSSLQKLELLIVTRCRLSQFSKSPSYIWMNYGQFFTQKNFHYHLVKFTSLILLKVLQVLRFVEFTRHGLVKWFQQGCLVKFTRQWMLDVYCICLAFLTIPALWNSLAKPWLVSQGRFVGFTIHTLLVLLGFICCFHKFGDFFRHGKNKLCLMYIKKIIYWNFHTTWNIKLNIYISTRAILT